MRTVLRIIWVILLFAMEWAAILEFPKTALVLGAIWSIGGVCFAVTGDTFK